MWNFHIGRVMGIPIQVNVTLLLFLPVLAWLIAAGEQIAVYAELINGLSPQALDSAALTAGSTEWLIGLLGAVGLFVSVLIHELGHSWVARRYDIEIASITLWIFGGMAHMSDLPEDWNMELWIAVAGPVTSVLLSAVLYGVLLVLPGGLPVAVFVVGFLSIVNVSLAVFNLLPAFPMDGGRIFRALLASRQSYVQATRTAALLGKGFAVLMAIVGLFVNPLLLLIALFVYIAASAESRATVLRDLLRGVTVRDLMNRDVRTVSADTSVQGLVDRIMLERLTGYPVVGADGTLVGVVSLEDVRSIPAAERDATAVSEIMNADPRTVEPDTEAFEALVTLSETDAGPLVVADGGRLLGVVSREDVVSALEVIQGLRPARGERELAPEGYA